MLNLDKMESNQRRLPVYLLLDTSGSMYGQPIEALRQGVKYLISSLKKEPQAIETAYLSVITFSSTAKQVVPLTDLQSFREPQLDANGTTALGEALKILDRCLDTEVKKSTATQKGDYKPLVFILTDGVPTDSWEGPANVMKQKAGKLANIIAVGCGPDVDLTTLKKITEIVLHMESYQPDDFNQFFRWVSASVSMASQKFTADGEKPAELPPPPPTIQIVP
ncbi:vWA domain-containing protein [Heliorestis convoluta]|uniref:Tellurium resistance protein TerY n=1 Tax=Heliorestis convoluta TaxID=356322 RepID=A0A5Q2MXD2_9FIRM|nr:VWA domain-containing protein [Heliorestis convoluta]QGG46491.1 tellurium resistance protein TerY [Heliorestis convoluta]